MKKLSMRTVKRTNTTLCHYCRVLGNIFKLSQKCVFIKFNGHETWLHGLVKRHLGGVLRERRPPVELHLKLLSIFGMYELHDALMNNVRLHTTHPATDRGNKSVHL